MGRRRRITDEQILDTASRLFRRHGRGVGTRAIASAAGVAECVLYQRFGSKEELFLAAMIPIPVPVEELLGPRSDLDVVASTPSAREYVHRLATSLVAVFRREMPGLWVVLGCPDIDPRRLDQWQATLRLGAVHDEVAWRLRVLADRRLIAIGSPYAAASLLLAAAQHEVLTNEVMWSHRPFLESFTTVLDQLWSGMEPRPERRSAGAK